MRKDNFYFESCDMYEFMSDYVGLKILHPGGVEATGKLVELLNIDKDKKVLDIACGKGLTSVYLAKKYGCRVTGIDISEKSVNEAKELSKRQGVSHLASFRAADACKLPFSNDEFDITLAQAMLVLVKDTDKVKVIEEATRVLKKGGRTGWSELSWRKQPAKEFLEAAAKETCAKGIANAMTFDSWEALFKKGGVKEISSDKIPMRFRGISGIVADEGIVNGLKIIFKYLANSAIRARMKRLNKFFKAYPEYLGYGIYVGTK